MAVGRAERWKEREPRVAAVFGHDELTLRRVSKLFELLELAWQACYGELTPPEEVVNDVLLCSGGTLGGLIDASQLAVVDRRDLQLWADDLRRRAAGPEERPG